MTLNFNPRQFLLSEGIRWKKRTAALLDQAQGFDGRRLAPKVYPNGRALGYDDSLEGVPGRIRRAPVTVRGLSGWQVDVAHALKDRLFNDGRRGQVPRPFAGIDDEFLAQAGRNFVEWLRQEGRRRKLFT